MVKRFLLLGLIIIILSFSSCVIFSKKCDTQLNTSILSGNLEGVKEAIQEKANVNRIVASDKTRFDTNDHNPVGISLCINDGHHDICQYLIEHGSNPNYMGNLGKTFLMDSVQTNNIDFCDFLLAHGAEIGQIGNKRFAGDTALDCISLNENLSKYSVDDYIGMYHFLIQHGAKVTPHTLQVSLQKEDYGYRCYPIIQTELKVLLKNDQQSGLNKLLEYAILCDNNKIYNTIHTMKPDQADQDNILFFTAALGSVDTMKLLQSQGYDLNVVDFEGMNLLAIAAKYNTTDMVKYLYNQGINSESTDSQDFNALSQAISNGETENAKFLLGIGVQFQVSDDVGPDDLKIAAINKTSDMAAFVIKNGYVLNQSNEYNAMSAALKCNRLDVVRYFINLGFNLNYNGNMGSILTVACGEQNLNAVKLLVEHGADVNGGKDRGAPLLNAAQFRNVDIAKYLIAKGADVNAVDKESDGSQSMTALSQAIYSGSLDSVKLLVEHGANINYINKSCDNQTALQIAEGQPSQNIINYLNQKEKRAD